MRLREFAPARGGNSGDYLKALASAWYNGVFDTGSLPRGIKTQEDIERLLNRGIVCPDGKTRKLHIDYNSDFDGVEIYSDDYYEHGDLDGNDGRTGQPWGPYDHMEFKDEELDEGVAEGSLISGDGGAVDNFKQQMANNTELAYQKGMAEARKKKKKKSSKSLRGYFFPGYGYYGTGDSGESGGDGGGESKNRGMTEGSEDPFGPQGRYVGDTGPAQVSTTVARVQLKPGDQVLYKPTEQRARIEAISKDGTQARIHVATPMGGRTFNCKTSDLKALNRGLAEGRDLCNVCGQTPCNCTH